VDVLPYLNQPCTITHVAQNGAEDPYGNPTETTTTTELDGAPGCWIVQGKRDDVTLLTNQQSEVFTGYFPAGTQLDGSDRVTVDGATFEVQGPPWRAFNPLAAAVDFVEATLVRVV
jgi:hypothetical protein